VLSHIWEFDRRVGKEVKKRQIRKDPDCEIKGMIKKIAWNSS
jgi:hypothetical protein